MVGVAQLVRAPDCGSGGRGFETPRPPHSSRWSVWGWTGLAGVLALGAALRVAMLPGATLGYDGLQSVTHAARGIPTGLLSAFLHDPHPPLYYALLSLWLRVGTSDAAILL